MRPSGGGKTRLVFHAPSRGLIGYHGEFLTDTRGTGVMNRLFHGYAPYKGADRGPAQRRADLHRRRRGGGLCAVVPRGARPAVHRRRATKVYEGMIIGEHSRGNDLEVNPLKGKQLTNIRATGKDEAVRLTPPRRMTLEQAIAYIEDDELVEVTPKSIRLRKRCLDPARAQARQEAGRRRGRRIEGRYIEQPTTPSPIALRPPPRPSRRCSRGRVPRIPTNDPEFIARQEARAAAAAARRGARDRAPQRQARRAGTKAARRHARPDKAEQESPSRPRAGQERLARRRRIEDLAAQKATRRCAAYAARKAPQEVATGFPSATPRWLISMWLPSGSQTKAKRTVSPSSARLAARGAAARQDAVVLGDAVPDLHRHVAIARSAPFLARARPGPARRPRPANRRSDSGLRRRARTAWPRSRSGRARAGSLTLSRMAMPCTPFCALGHQLTLLPSGSARACAVASPSRAISSPTMPDGGRSGRGSREWFIFRIEPFM